MLTERQAWMKFAQCFDRARTHLFFSGKFSFQGLVSE